jgi:DNA-binding XRE family transcriptional regulator
MTSLQFREARLSFGLTQSAWGLCLGIGREHIAKIETGRAPVSKTLALLVSAYKRHGLPAPE